MSAQELPSPREPRARRSPSLLLLLAGLGVGALALVFWTVVDGELDPGDAPPAAAPAGRPLPPVPRPEDSRAQTQRVGRKILAHPVIGAGYLAQLLSEGSTGRFPAATRRRRALADELAAALSGHHLTGDQVLAVARALAAAANPGGLAPQELTAQEAALGDALAGAGVDAAAAGRVAAAYRAVLLDPQKDALARLAAILQRLQHAETVGAGMVEELHAALQGAAAARPPGAAAGPLPGSALLARLAAELADALARRDLTYVEMADLVYALEPLLHGAAPDAAAAADLIQETAKRLQTVGVEAARLATLTALLTELAAATATVGGK